jgi:hypothetical protein
VIESLHSIIGSKFHPVFQGKLSLIIACKTVNFTHARVVMMNEDRILELLAEYLRKTDQIMERLDKQAVVWSQQQEAWGRQEEFRKRQDQRLDVAYQVLVAHSEKIEKLQEESAELRKKSIKLEQQSQKIERRSDATWKQFIALAKKTGRKPRKR